MIQVFELMPGITLRCFRDLRFKQGRLLLRFARPMDRVQCGMSTLMTSVLLQGTGNYPDMQCLARRSNELYGLSLGAGSTRVGDYHAFGFGAAFLDDRFAFDGGNVFADVTEHLRELLLNPLTEDGAFCRQYVEREKINLISDIDAFKNDKTLFANMRLQQLRGQRDSLGIARLGNREDIRQFTAQALYDHYLTVLKTSPVEICYVGSLPAEQVRDLTAEIFRDVTRAPLTLPPQTAFRAGDFREVTEEMDVTQTRLCMGLHSPITVRDPQFQAMRLCNAVYGGGAVSKLFMTIREKLSLCYDISSGMLSSKGSMVVTAGIDASRVDQVREQALALLEDCRQCRITEKELQAAKSAVITSLKMVADSVGSIESYYANAGLVGAETTPEQEIAAVEAVTAEQVAEAARTLELDTVYVMKGAK